MILVAGGTGMLGRHIVQRLADRGERVRVLPNHACVVSNLHDRVLAVRGERVEEEWRVAARGRVE